MNCRIVAVTALLLLFTGCVQPDPQQEEAILPEFTVVDETTTDIPIKAQVEQHLLVSGSITEDGLRALLRQQYDEIRGRRGFEYHDRPTNVYIYLYETRDRAEAGQGLWLAMLSKDFSDDAPSLTVRSDQVASVGVAPEERLGLTEEERKAIFRESVLAERRAYAYDASAQAPGDVMGQAEIRSEVMDRYMDEVAARHDLTREQLDQIGLEGVMNRWPMPPTE